MPVAEGVGAHQALPLEAEPFVEGDRRGVVGVDGELEAAQVEPVVGGVDQRGQDGRADAAALEGVADAHADDGRVLASTGLAV